MVAGARRRPPGRRSRRARRVRSSASRRPSTADAAQLEPAAALDLDRLGHPRAQRRRPARRLGRASPSIASTIAGTVSSARGRALERHAPVAQHRDLVAQRHHVLEDVRDEHDADLAVAQHAQRVEQHRGRRRARAPRSARRGSAPAARSAAPWRSRAAGARPARARRPARAAARRGPRSASTGRARAAIAARSTNGPRLRLAHRVEVREDVEVGEQVELLRDDRDAARGRPRRWWRSAPRRPSSATVPASGRERARR